MTQAKPCPGPYRSDGYVKAISCGRVQGPYGTMAHVFGANAGQMAATARLLAASWDMRELLIELAGHYSKASDEALKQWAATDLQAGRMIRLRKLLVEIDGVTEQRK